MKIKLVKGAKTAAELARARRLYVSAFPSEERAPFPLLAVMNIRGNVDFWDIYTEDSQWAGIMYVVTHGDLAYVFYFAIDERRRGGHIGSAAVRAVMKYYDGMRLFLAIEPVEEGVPNYDERVRRRKFYLRCGLRCLDSYVREGSMVYELIGSGGRVSDEDYCGLMRDYLGFPLKYFVPLKVIDNGADKK